MPCILKKLKTYQVHRKNQIKTIVAIMTLPLSLSAGFALDNPIASASLSTLQGVNSSNAANTQEALGVEAHAVGDQSSMSGDSMGAVGKRIATMSLVMKPQCNSDTVLNGLDGAELKFPCQPISSALTGTICLPKLADCKDSKNFAPLVVPLGSNNNIYGYNFTASCQASCTIKMSQNGAVITNADSITNQSKQAAAKNDQYNIVAQGYIGKDGYSKQQAYMWSFSKGGSNDVIGTQCINGAVGYLKNGEYHTCDNKEQGAMGQGCKTQKICLDWDIVHQIITTNRNCTLTSGSKDIQCPKVPKVEIVNEPYTTTVTYKGQLASPTPTTGQIISPESGHIIYASVSLFNYGNNIYSCFQSYWGVIGGLKSNSFHPQCGGGTDGSGFVFTNNGLNISATANQPITWTLGCSTGGCSSSVAASRAWSITMQVTRYKKVAHVTWSTQCPTN